MMGKKSKSQTTGAAKDEVDQDETKGDRVVSVFLPKSADFIKVMACVKKGNRYKTNKFLLRGCESGCTYSLSTYAKVLCYSVDMLITNGGFPHILTPTGSVPVLTPGDDVIHHENLPIAMPICLEGLIRGSSDSFCVMIRIIYEFYRSRPDCFSSSNNKNLSAIINYWSKYYDKQDWLYYSEKESFGAKKRKESATKIGNCCHGCDKIESETVTLEKCSRCNFYYYCSTECQKKKWRDGHAGECNHLAILKQYHRPHGKHIRDSLINGVDPKNIPELQELRHRLGLDKPKAEYEVLLEQATKSDGIKPIELVPPNKDGTVQIGSYPYPM